ncbi:MAG TPA: hypothetical protein VK775_24175 [Chthoniobacterales bacterium]|nr:hypothetical protein [Chthoniobacterales bacterium]
MPPTYLFVGCLGLILIIGHFKSLAAGGHPHPVVSLPAPQPGKEQIN